MSFSVVILSARAENLVPCVRAVLGREPGLPPERVVVVDDGARAGAEPHLPGVRWVTGAKPFVFARNANLGIRAAGTDVVLLNDDARPLTPFAFTRLAEHARARPDVGVCSAGIRGVVANPRQVVTGRPDRLTLEPDTLAFVCVYIPWSTYTRVGPLDERFTGYGFEDTDYCIRVRAAGLQLAVWKGCAVDHGGSLPSTYRTRADHAALFRHNQLLFEAKLREGPPRGEPAGAKEPTMTDPRRVDLLYLAYNRLEFTRETFTALVANTDWQFVHELHAYDDGSQDGTCEWLEQAVGQVPVPVRFERTRFRSPPASTVYFFRNATAPVLAKTDSDAMLPPGWLAQGLAVLDRHPELEMLGIEAMNPLDPDPAAVRGYTPAEFISGLGFYLRAAFRRGYPTPYEKYFGLEEWQVAQGPGLVRGWIAPALSVFLLDRHPHEPWASLSADYVRRGWQRAWPKYPTDSTLWAWRWPDGAACTPAAAAIDLGRLNLGFCGDSAPGFTNVNVLPQPGPGDVDLKQPWPWPDDSFDHVRAREVLEHLPEKVRTMNELWRVLKPGGTAEVAVPTTEGTGAFQDPTHVSFWNRRSFLYYEAGHPYRERFARHYGIIARFRVVSERTDHTPDGPALTMLLAAVKGPAPAPAAKADRRDVAAAGPWPPGDPRFLCAMRVKNEAAHLHEVIASVLPFCQRVFVFDDHSTDETPEICRAFGERVALFPSPFRGLDESRDKNFLLKHVIQARPEWVLWIDGDEALERSGPERLAAAARDGAGVGSYSLRIAYVWDDPQHVRVDGIYGRFARPSFFRLQGQAHSRLQFLATGRGGNFHCGNVPAGLAGRLVELGVRLKHYGYMSREQRRAKYVWYTTVDRHNAAEDHYRHLAEAPGARHAPGPPVIVPWED
jgi:GT2 family glycosyltransferase/SAM-dependent methyltransferase